MYKPKTNSTDGKTAELYESPSKERNEARYRVLSGKQCICCMRPLKAGESKSVHINTDWRAVHVSIEAENCLAETGHESQGYFDIGNTCAAKMPAGFVHK